MRLNQWRQAGVMLVLMLGQGMVLLAQPITPRIGYVFPAGGRQGTTFQVKVGGQYLEGVTNAFICGGGVQVKVVDFNKPLSVGQFTKLRDEIKELQDKKSEATKSSKRSGKTTATWTAADEKQIEEIRAKMFKNPPKRPGNPAIDEVATVQVTIAPDAEPGEREVRLGTPFGLSNPLIFFVSQLTEYAEKNAKPTEEKGNFKSFKKKTTDQTRYIGSDTQITLPATVNGQIMPGAVDHYRFYARKGTRLVVVARARQLIPYLPDAVPGWFQATLALFDSKGKELAYDDDFQCNPDPVLYFEIPRDGEYMVEVKDAIYRGREDFVYRITLGELPFVTGIFPLGGPVGSKTSVELKGWNLPVTNIVQDASNLEPGIHSLALRKEDRVINRVPFMVDNLPECLEREPNTSESPQRITLPVIVNGRIGAPGDWDVFCFDGKAGSEIVAEVFARRLNSPLDSMLKLTDAAGKQLAFNDDHEDKGSGLNTHHADSFLRATLPANGTYYLYLGDAQRKGGPEFAYRLRVSAPQPDFALRVVPSSVSVRGGTSVPITVYALRKDGFSNEIALVLKDAPAGFTLTGAKVPAGQDQVRLTLTAPAITQDYPVSLHLVGTATLQGRTVTRLGVPADDMMQAFAYRHLVPAQEFKVDVFGRYMAKRSVRILSATPVKIPAGGTARLEVGIPLISAFVGKIDLELSEPPEGISIKNIAPAGEGTEIVLQCDGAKAKPGLKGNLIFTAFAGKFPNAPAKTKPGMGKFRPSLGALPAVPFEIVEQKLSAK
ncbi:MAG: hypothetical protein WCO56_04460 [Verrucomicrobiota bacterium]